MDIFYGSLGMSKRQADEWIREGWMLVREYEKRQLLFRSGENSDSFGIVLSGTVLAESVNRDGQRRILDCYEPGEAFRKDSLPPAGHNSYYFITRTKSQVAFIKEKKAAAGAKGAGEEGRPFAALLLAGQQKAFLHIDVLGQRTLRQKLLAYLEYLGTKKGKRAFTLPMSWTECADYLAADRSAMMRELAKLKEEGLLCAQGRRVELKSDPSPAGAGSPGRRKGKKP